MTRQIEILIDELIANDCCPGGHCDDERCEQFCQDCKACWLAWSEGK